MLAHLLKPIWKRKSRHLLLSLELLLAFLVVFAIAAFAGRFYQLSRLPIGFDYASVWSVSVETADQSKLDSEPELLARFKRALEALPEVEQVGFASFPPYQMSTQVTDYTRPGNSIGVLSESMDVSDDFFAVMGMSIEEGRWFSGQDSAAAEQPVVINRRLAQALFPGESALGQMLMVDFSSDGSGERALKVTGVFSDFRNKGEFSTPVNFVLARSSPRFEDSSPRAIVLRLRPGTSRDFEATLSQQLKLIRGDWSYRITPLSELRNNLRIFQQTPLLLLAVIAAFLLVMVAFGLFGVLWQNTTQRIPELGLRRALGAPAGSIYRQIILEQLLLSSLAMAAGLVLAVQVPLTGIYGEALNWPLFVAAVVAAMVVIYLLSALCALYPAWRASRLSPSEALHYE